MRRSLPYIILGLSAAAVAGTGILLFSYAFRRGESFAEGSSYRATEDGLRALALLMESQGHAVARLADPWGLKGMKGVLVSSAAHHAPVAAKGG